MIVKDSWSSEKQTKPQPGFVDCMLDLETWGKKPGCAIRSIGAVMFDRMSCRPGDEFYANVATKSCTDAGLTIDPDTERWWAKQSAEARQSLTINPWPVEDALRAFIGWFKENKGVRVWCLGATFDAPVIEEAFSAFNLKPPWQYWAVRCVRTHYDVHHFDPSNIKRQGTYHNALDDAKHQLYCMRVAQL